MEEFANSLIAIDIKIGTHIAIVTASINEITPHIGESITGLKTDKLKLEKFFFVSCWAHDPNESLPQWNMYTRDMAGVRISLPKKMFSATDNSASP